MTIDIAVRIVEIIELLYNKALENGDKKLRDTAKSLNIKLVYDPNLCTEEDLKDNSGASNVRA